MSTVRRRPSALLAPLVLSSFAAGAGSQEAHPAPGAPRPYENRLVPIRDPRPLLADHPEFVAPIEETARFEAPPLLDEEGADLAVRAWRFSYNARGIVETPNRLRAERTAVITVHPWGIDDGQGWRTPEPAGAAFQCTPAKNAIVNRHLRQVVSPFLKALRGRVRLVAFSLPGSGDPIQKKLYRSFGRTPTASEREEGRRELAERLGGFAYRGGALPGSFPVSAAGNAAADYFRSFPGLDAGARFNQEGFWDLPTPVNANLEAASDDLAIFDGEGYPALRDFLEREGVRHILLLGYNTDMCVASTTAGHQNLSRDFNVFLVGDATIATFPANPTPRHATNAAVSLAALSLFITQVSWVRPLGDR